MRYYKFWFFLLLSLLGFTSFGSAYVWLVFNLPNNLSVDDDIGRNRFNPIHFNAGGNYFGGELLWINTYDSSKKITAQGGSVTLDCNRRIKGLYYNDQRGERLRPLDEESRDTFFRDDHSLQPVEWGLYTSCSGAESLGDPRWWGIYGHVKHTYNWEEYNLIAGLKYNTPNTNNPGTPQPVLGPTVQSFDNKIPLGLIYDYNGGLGFLWCEVKNADGLTAGIVNQLNTTGVKDSFVRSGDFPKPITGYESLLDCSHAGSSIDTLLLLKIQGLIGMSTDTKDVGQLLGNEADAKTQYFSSVQLNNASLVNLAKQKAEELCRGKWSTNFPQGGNIICVYSNNDNTIHPTIDDIKGRILIAKNVNVTLQGAMYATTPELNIFIDGGTLALAQNSANRIQFNENGYPTTGSGSYTGIYLKGNFIINGLVIGNGNDGSLPTMPYKTFIHGKFTSLNTYIEPTSQRISQLKNLLGATPAEKTVDLREVFSRRCDYGIDNDDHSKCPVGEFQTAPLVIINQNYPSKLVE